MVTQTCVEKTKLFIFLLKCALPIAKKESIAKTLSFLPLSFVFKKVVQKNEDDRSTAAEQAKSKQKQKGTTHMMNDV